MITKKEITYSTFGNCLELSNGIVRLVITTDIGPRIIRYSFIDGENVMFEDTEHSFCGKGETMDQTYGEGSFWCIYGGHRLWTSPERSPRVIYPDNEPVTVTPTENGAIFTPPVQSRNQVMLEIEVSLSENSTDVTVTHRVKNCAPWSVTLAPWAISVLAPGGTEVFPQPTLNTGLLGNRLLALWPYTKLTDSRLTLLDRYLLLYADETVSDKFKLGMNSQHGCILYFNHGDVFIKRFSPNPKGTYPDGGMSFETYTNGLFLEMETLGELKDLEPGKTAEHTEFWSLAKGDLPEINDDSLEQAVKQYVR